VPRSPGCRVGTTCAQSVVQKATSSIFTAARPAVA
jgi:hypothetical protein